MINHTAGEPDSDLKISCRQISPFIPHNYTESSFPVCVFSYVLVNTGNENADVSLLFTWANSIGGTSASTGGHFNEPYVDEDGVRGVHLHHETAAKGGRPVTFAIAAKETQGVTISTFPCFSILDKEGDHSAKAMWGEMKEKGAFDSGNWHSGISKPSQKGASIGAALAAQVLIPPNEKKEVVFALAWDSPEAKFGKGTSYYRCASGHFKRMPNLCLFLPDKLVTTYFALIAGDIHSSMVPRAMLLQSLHMMHFLVLKTH
jgi:non-lysosomal glucosylceramidase